MDSDRTYPGGELIYFFLIITYLFQTDSTVKADSIYGIIPSWDIVYSDIYHRQFVKDFSDFDYQLLQQQNEELHRYIRLYLNSMLDIIPLYTGFTWKENYHINIYPTRSKISFSHPLTLMYSPDQRFLFYMLIHEVIHHNMRKEDFPSRDMYEAFTDKVAIQASKFLPPELQGHHKKIVYYPLQKFYNWQVDTLNVREWLDQNKVQLERDRINYAKLTNALQHGDENQILDLFEPLKSDAIQEFSEKSYYFVIRHFNEIRDYDEALELAEEYAKKFPDGALYNSIRFTTAEILMMQNKADETEKVLTEITKRNKDVNNYLDDAYLRIADLANGNGNQDKAVQSFLYILDMLPRGESKVHAATSLARIYARKDDDYAANRFYFKAIFSTTDDRLKAQILIELKLVLIDKFKEIYIEELLKILSKSMINGLKTQLQEIYKDLL